MKHLFSTRVRVVLILAILLAIGIAVLGSITNVNIGAVAVQGILAPMRAGVSYLTDQAEQLYSYMFRYDSLAAENAKLKEQLAAIEDDIRQADAEARENERLRDLLNLKSTDEAYEFVDAYIISWSSNEWSNTITINRGTNAGIERNMCAVTATGQLVGLVSEVGSNYAVIETILDSSVGISASISGSGRVTGVSTVKSSWAWRS